jgi:uroporphyrinogen III methyltransferase/synthase
VALIQWGTTAAQKTVVGTAVTIADLAEAASIVPPALAVVGDVVTLREKLAWVERKPLFGRRIVVTRPRAQASAFSALLADAGAEVIPCATIEIAPPRSWEPLDAAIRRLEEFDWAVFTSANGVSAFFERLGVLRRDVRSLHRARLAAVGPATARELERHGLLVDVVPEEYRAEGVAAALLAAGIAGRKVLLARAAAAREVLPDTLRAAGALLEEVASYQTIAARTDAAEIRALLAAGAIDLVTFTSSSTVRSFLGLVGSDAVSLLARSAIGCIGPITAETAREAGLEVTIQPSAYTIPAFAEAVVAHFAPPRSRANQSTSRGAP